MLRKKEIIPYNIIENKILIIRGQKVLIDADLAVLYGVSTKVLNQAIKRNKTRFPDDFMFKLTKDEKNEVVTVCDHLQKLKYSPVCPFAFTEHGVIMAASMLNSPKAVQVSVYVVRVFIKLRQMLVTNKELALKLQLLEKRLESHDSAIRSLVSTIKEMTAPILPAKRRKLGF